jgi:uncharacterized cofD-like protein
MSISENANNGLNRPDRPNIVIIGGGAGVATALTHLKKVSNVTAIVSMMDSGGSSGKLRDEYGVLPPGDVLRCFSKLLPDDENSNKWRDFLNYSFRKGEGLKDHTLGNLLLTAAYDWEGGTSFGIEALSWLLNLEGRVLPVTLNNVELIARLSDGSEVSGEIVSALREHPAPREIEYITLSRRAQIFPPAAEAIHKADKVVIGPGSLFTSVLPNLLVEGVAEALAETSAIKIFVCNLVTDPAETNGYKASDFLQKISEYLQDELVDYAIVNNGPMSDLARRMYETEQKFPVEPNIDAASQFVRRQIITGAFSTGKTYVRHDSEKLAQTILQLN